MHRSDNASDELEREVETNFQVDPNGSLPLRKLLNISSKIMAEDKKQGTRSQYRGSYLSNEDLESVTQDESQGSVSTKSMGESVKQSIQSRGGEMEDISAE